MRNPKIGWIVAIALVILAITAWLFWPRAAAQVIPIPEADAETQADQLQKYLESKDSPLAPDAEFVVTLKHWKLLVAISAIESQFCKRQIDHNCWGIGGDSAYRHYSSFRSAAVDANDLIEKWQQKNRWLTVDDMNCSYVVPCNQNWVNVVNSVLDDLGPI